MTDYFTADLHLGHVNIAGHRGYSADHPGTVMHDDDVLDNISATLRHNDRLFILGDLTNGGIAHEDEALLTLSRSSAARGYEIHFIAGNHDTCHPMRSKAHRRLRDFSRNLDSVASAGSLKIAGQRALLHHFCYDGDHTGGDRFTQWRPRDEGAIIIHGHTHAAEPVSYSEAGTLQICVSLEAWDMKPVSKETLTDLINSHQ